MKSIHPFPARMAPELALSFVTSLPKGAKILDPMAGSGTVLRQAVLSGHDVIGYDMDPLAVLMSRSWTRPVSVYTLERLSNATLRQARALSVAQSSLPWLDSDPETIEFIDFWFAERQKNDLRKLAHVLFHSDELQANPHESDVIKIAFSRIIITKIKGASLAWDVSHSRPHKVKTTNDFDVLSEFEKSIEYVTDLLKGDKIKGSATTILGDARSMEQVAPDSIDAVITSPPYLNAIDYLRGHKLSLVWLGYKISEIRKIRGDSIGAERKANVLRFKHRVTSILSDLGDTERLPSRFVNIVERYADDACALMTEIQRVLKGDAKARLIVGNSCLRDVFVRNSLVFKKAAEFAGLCLTKETSRDLPIGNRYLPLPSNSDNALGKRMKSEVIMDFALM